MKLKVQFANLVMTSIFDLNLAAILIQTRFRKYLYNTYNNVDSRTAKMRQIYVRAE